ncbi:MAG: hypothetical protein M1489_07655, partial [Firmicutes bacterium]|nr:hypothetical protein [Bacillota bacterium]
VQPLLMREIFVPLWRYQVQALKNEKVPVFFHSDGNIISLLHPRIGEALFFEVPLPEDMAKITGK